MISRENETVLLNENIKEILFLAWLSKERQSVKIDSVSSTIITCLMKDEFDN